MFWSCLAIDFLSQTIGVWSQIIDVWDQTVAVWIKIIDVWNLTNDVLSHVWSQAIDVLSRTVDVQTSEVSYPGYILYSKYS